jgi:hypothetical protein
MFQHFTISYAFLTFNSMPSKNHCIFRDTFFKYVIICFSKPHKWYPAMITAQSHRENRILQLLTSY